MKCVKSLRCLSKSLRIQDRGKKIQRAWCRATAAPLTMQRSIIKYLSEETEETTAPDAAVKDRLKDRLSAQDAAVKDRLSARDTAVKDRREAQTGGGARDNNPEDGVFYVFYSCPESQACINTQLLNHKLDGHEEENHMVRLYAPIKMDKLVFMRRVLINGAGRVSPLKAAAPVRHHVVGTVSKVL